MKLQTPKDVLEYDNLVADNARMREALEYIDALSTGYTILAPVMQRINAFTQQALKGDE